MITKRDLKIALLIAAGFISPADASDFFTAIKSPIRTTIPSQFEILSTYSHADKLVDKNGNSKPIHLSRWKNTLMLKGKTSNFYGSVAVPFTSVTNDTIDERLSGFGDIGFEVGPHFKKGDLYFMPTASYYLGTGKHDPHKPLNLGTGKDWMGGSLYFTLLQDDWIFDLYGGHFNQQNGPLYRNRFGGAAGLKKDMLILGVGMDYTQGYGGQEILTLGPLIRYIDPQKRFHITGGFEIPSHIENSTKDNRFFLRLRIPLGQSKAPTPRNHPAGQRNYNNPRK